MTLRRSLMGSTDQERPCDGGDRNLLGLDCRAGDSHHQVEARDRILVVVLVALPVVCTFLFACGTSSSRRREQSPAGFRASADCRRCVRTAGRGQPFLAPFPPCRLMHRRDSLTRSGLYDSPSSAEMSHPDMAVSGNFSIIDMVSRLEPREFRWVGSSLAEQEFLGWTLGELRLKSFLDIVHPDDRARAVDGLHQALIKGEFLGLIIRIRTAQGKTKAIEVNAGARYSSDHRVSYLRCHLADVTVKVRAERELRLRTRELIQVNEQLRRINSELEELKNRYTDLYENAPAMYFGLDSQGCLIECNQTFLTTLNRRRDELIGHGFDRFLEGSDLKRLAHFAQLLESGSVETESRLGSIRWRTD